MGDINRKLLNAVNDFIDDSVNPVIAAAQREEAAGPTTPQNIRDSLSERLQEGLPEGTEFQIISANKLAIESLQNYSTMMREAAAQGDIAGVRRMAENVHAGVNAYLGGELKEILIITSAVDSGNGMNTLSPTGAQDAMADAQRAREEIENHIKEEIYKDIDSTTPELKDQKEQAGVDAGFEEIQNRLRGLERLDSVNDLKAGAKPAYQP